MDTSTQYSLAQLLQTSILIIDAEGAFVWMNDSAEALLLQSLRRLKGKSLEQVFIDGDLDLAQIRHCIEQKGQWQLQDTNLVTLQRHLPHCQMNMTYQLLDRQPVVIIEIFASPDQMGLRKEYQLLDQNNVSLSLVRNLAHEIKNPLSGLRGAAQLLARKVSAELHRYTDIIIAEADRLQQLVDRLLTPAKPETPSLTNLHQITERGLAFFEIQDHPDLILRKDYDPSLPELVIASEQVYQAFLNLLKNACEAIDYHGCVTVRTRAVHQHSIGPRQYKLMARIDVTDNGPGISDEIRDLIFFPTISGKQSSGLGLGIAQTLIRQNEGIIEFSSEPGKTCFSIFLPIEPHKNDAPVQSTSRV